MLKANEAATMDVAQIMSDMGTRARAAARPLAIASSDQKNKALLAMAEALEARVPAILAANEKDLERGRANSLSAALMDRLMLDEKRIAGIASGIRSIGRAR